MERDEMEKTFLSGNNTKAGVPELSRERIDQIILEASRNSKFYQHQQRRLQQVAERAQALRSQQHTDSECVKAEAEIHDFLGALRERQSDTSQTFVHVDMDAFFAAVEQLYRPELSEVPMAVGAEPMLSTANYKARQFGVSAAMPGFIARKLCPQLVIVPLDYDRYVLASEQVHAIFRLFDPTFLSFSLDEASLHIPEGDKPVWEVVAEMRALVKERTGLSCSAGIGPTRQLAKMASNINKPDGQFAVPSNRHDLLAWLSLQPVKRICGAGKVTCALLRDAYDIVSIGDLQRHQVKVWLGMTRCKAEFLVSAAHGLAPSMYDGDGDEEDGYAGRKSLSVERTHFPAITNIQQMDDILVDLSNLLFDDLSAKQLGCSCVSIKVKLADFQTLTRSATVGHRVDTAKEIWKIASGLLHKLVPASARLLGIRASGLESTRPTLLDAFLRSGGGQVDVDVCVECPVCCNQVAHTTINEHLDTCLRPVTEKPKKRAKVGPMDFFTKPGP